MSDYSFLKTGHNLIETNTNNKELETNVKALVFSFVENAIKGAEIYVEHGNRNSITPEDINLCLKVETFKYLQRENIGDSIQKWKNIINEEDDDLEEDTLEDDDNLEDDDDNFEEDAFSKNDCKCINCRMMNDINMYWEQWIPGEGLETILKNAIDKVN